ncbi:MAG: tetratricopeptide repeat protein [Dehalococcoidia bacterium]|nr:tetratricopeptide repeat protein [Dehalococcoidia bacterium]
MKILISVVVAFVAIFAISSVSYGDELTDMDIFAVAGAFYEDGNYEEAARTYQHLVGLGYEDPTLFYNLANSYYKSDDLGRAILNYLRAKRFAPFDEDIAANLEFVRQQLDSPNSRESATPVFVQLSEFVPWVTFNQAAIATLVSWLVAGVLAALYIWGGRFRTSMTVSRLAAVAVLCIFIFGSITIGKHMDRLHWERIAVVTAESAGVYHGPRESLDPRFSLDAGSEVRLIDRRGRWSKIGILDTGVEGWVESASVEGVLAPGG